MGINEDGEMFCDECCSDICDGYQPYLTLIDSGCEPEHYHVQCYLESKSEKIEARVLKD